MQSADPSTLFQSDASLAIGQSRALKASKTSTGSAWGSPIWLGHKHEDVEKLASGGAGADGGPGKVLGMEVDQERQLVWTAESGGSVRGVCLEVSRAIQEASRLVRWEISEEFTRRGVILDPKK